MNSVIIPQMYPMHHKGYAAAAGYGVPAQGYLSYTPQQYQQQQQMTPTDVFSVAAAAMMPPVQTQHFQKRQMPQPQPTQQQQQQAQFRVPPMRYQPYPVVSPNKPPEVRTTSSTRPNREVPESVKF